MTMEMAMNGIVEYAPYIAAVIGATLGLSTFGLFQIRELKAKFQLYDAVEAEVESALISADRVLKNGATPAAVRASLLCMLETLASPSLGRVYVEKYHYLSRKARNKGRRKPGSTNELILEMDKLHVKNPELAADAHNALMGMILALPVIHADRIDAFEYAGEGATNPSSVFDRAARALSASQDKLPPGVDGNGLAMAG